MTTVVPNKRVVVFGEVLVDVFSDGAQRPAAGERKFRLEGVPGGAPCNVACNLASLGFSTAFVGGFADDPVGEALREMLIERGIDLSSALTHPGSRSPLAMVLNTLDGDRDFRLYLSGSAVERTTVHALKPDALEASGWFHFGSVLLSFPSPKDVTYHLLRQARAQGMTTSYDVNVRPDLWHENAVTTDVLVDVLHLVDLVKLSDDDFAWIRRNLVEAKIDAPSDLFRYGCRIIALTHGSEGATVMTVDGTVRVSPPRVDVVDTTGAGDAFMAGLIARLYGNEQEPSLATLQRAGEFAASHAGRILQQRGAMPPIR